MKTILESTSCGRWWVQNQRTHSSRSTSAGKYGDDSNPAFGSFCFFFSFSSTRSEPSFVEETSISSSVHLSFWASFTVKNVLLFKTLHAEILRERKDKTKALNFVEDMANSRAREAPPRLRRSAFLAWRKRWTNECCRCPVPGRSRLPWLLGSRTSWRVSTDRRLIWLTCLAESDASAVHVDFDDVS